MHTAKEYLKLYAKIIVNHNEHIGKYCIKTHSYCKNCSSPLSEFRIFTINILHTKKTQYLDNFEPSDYRFCILYIPQKI